MTESCYLAVDLGAESGRVIAGLFDGKSVRLDEQHRFANGPVPFADSLRWDVVRLWNEIGAGLRQAGTAYGDRIQSIGVDTWGVDYVLLTKAGEMLGQAYCYRDERVNGLLEEVCARVGRDRIFAETGLQFMQINTLYQLVAHNRDHAGLLEKADRFLMMPDFFHWLLSGSQVVEFTNATTTQLFHPVQRAWSSTLIKELQLPANIFPETVAPGTVLGRLRESVADWTGLPRVNVVAPATHDTGAAVAAVPTDRTGTADWAYISSGTWSLMGVEVQDAVLTDRALALNVTNEGGVDGTYRLLKNIMGLWLVQQCRVSFQRQGQDISYGELAEMAANAEPFRSLVDPDDPSFLNPADMPTAIAEWCRATGQLVPTTPGQFARCALESLALKYRMVLGWLEELTGTRVEVVHIVGGGSRNELLNQFTADACGRPVVTGPIEATALGNVLLQARAAGEIGSLAELRDIVRNSSEMGRHEPRDTSAWDTAFERFQAALSQKS